MLDIQCKPENIQEWEGFAKIMQIVHQYFPKEFIQYDDPDSIATSKDFLRFKDLLVIGGEKTGKTNFLKQMINAVLLKYRSPEIVIFNPFNKDSYEEFADTADIIIHPEDSLGILDKCWSGTSTGGNMFIYIDSANTLIEKDEPRFVNAIKRILEYPGGNIWIYMATTGKYSSLPEDIRAMFQNRIIFKIPECCDAIMSEILAGTEDAEMIGDYEFLLYEKGTTTLYKNPPQGF